MVARPEEAEMVPERIEREILVEAPPDVVWSAITEPEHVSRWFGDAADIDLRPGGEASFTWNDDDGGTAHARIVTVERPHFFAFRWMRWSREHPTGPGLQEGNSTLVEFSLTAEGDGTRLRVVESGFDRLDGPDDSARTYFEENNTGWPKELGELRDYVRGALLR
jgi:uncharacterized protein YndB with AHSA1/START domain